MSRKIVNNLLAYAKQIDAENLVLSEEEQELNINYYLPDGVRKNFSLPKKYLNNIKKEVLRLIEDEDFENAKIKKKAVCFKTRKLKLDFLISVVSFSGVEKIIFDFKKNSNFKKWRLSELGLKAKDRQKLLSLLNKNRGLFIITGPKNSGRSSTLNALLTELENNDKSICVIGESKDNLNLIKMELNNDAFELARKGDIDIIAIDEIKNKEHLAQSFRLASYGKLVLIVIEADNLKDLAKKIKLAPWPEKEKIKLIKAINFQKLVKLRRLINNTKDKRQEIGRFKLLSFT